LDGVIVIGCGRGELLIASSTCIGHRRNPSGPVFAPNMDDEIRFHLTRVITTRTVPESCTFYRMRLHHVLLETGLLDEGLATARLHTNMIENPGMLLHMIEHSVLALLNVPAFRAYKLTLLVP